MSFFEQGQNKNGGGDNENDVLWFTSTQSEKLTKNKMGSFNGLYMCENLNVNGVGTCNDPKLIADVYDQKQNGERHRGLDLMNVQIDRSTSTIYAGYYDPTKNSFEILSAKMEIPVTFQSFFRTGLFASNNYCRLNCCGDGTHTYFKVQPRDFAVHGEDIFVSWDGFYQDCANEYSSKSGLLWTVGVSKILKIPECISTNGPGEVLFGECTAPVAIAYQDSTTARKKLLGYAGFAIGSLPSGGGEDIIFFLSALNNIEPSKILSNELWITREGGSSSQVVGEMMIDARFSEISVDDVGTIRLRKDKNGVPRGLCRTAYDGGITCHGLSISDSGNINFTSSKTYVTKEKIAESCTVQRSDHYPATKKISSVSTGLEVFWKDDSPDDTPAYLIFGCYGEINYHGNMTTAFPDGRLVQTLDGAYPGSLLMGPDLHQEEIVVQDSFPPPAKNNSPMESESQNAGLLNQMLFYAIVTAGLAFLVRKRLSNRRESVRDYEPVQTDIEDVYTTSYVELASPPHQTDER